MSFQLFDPLVFAMRELRVTEKHIAAGYAGYDGVALMTFPRRIIDLIAEENPTYMHTNDAGQLCFMGVPVEAV